MQKRASPIGRRSGRKYSAGREINGAYIACLMQYVKFLARRKRFPASRNIVITRSPSSFPSLIKGWVEQFTKLLSKRESFRLLEAPHEVSYECEMLLCKFIEISIETEILYYKFNQVRIISIKEPLGLALLK